MSGDSDPALVFVHCWTCRRRFWDGQAPAFGARYRVVTLDLAGLHPTDVAANRRHARHFDALILPGVGHYPMLEAPERFNALLAEAIRRVLSVAGAA